MVDDDAIVAHQIGRPLRGTADVVARCHLGLPTVIRAAPVLDDGTPFPTRYWLTCPVLDARVARLEAEGGVRTFDRRRRDDQDFALSCAAADARYAAERDGAVTADHSGPVPRGGVGGSGGGVKCLHAHTAHQLATGDNPIGASVTTVVGEPGCASPCVV